MYKKFLKTYLYFCKSSLPLSELKKEPKKFLVISHTALGDTLMSTPAIKSLRLSFPETEIIGVIHKNYLPLFKKFSYIFS